MLSIFLFLFAFSFPLFFCFFFCFFFLRKKQALRLLLRSLSSIFPAMSPSPSKRRSSSITLRYDIASTLLASGLLPLLSPKKLKRLPHLFCRVLELPFDSDTPVQIKETQDCFTFVIELPGLVAEDVRAEIIEIVPGATKVVIGGAERLRAVLDELEIDPWRFRLPPSTLLEAASAVYEHGVLTVTVPKASPIPLDEGRLERASVEIERDRDDTKTDDRSGPEAAGLETDAKNSSSSSGEDASSLSWEDTNVVMDAKTSASRSGEDVGTVLQSCTEATVAPTAGELVENQISGFHEDTAHVLSEVISLKVGGSADERVCSRPIAVH